MRQYFVDIEPVPYVLYEIYKWQKHIDRVRLRVLNKRPCILWNLDKRGH